MVRIIILQGGFLAFVKLSAKTKGFFFFPKGEYLRKNQRLRHKTKTTCAEGKKNPNQIKKIFLPMRATETHQTKKPRAVR